MNFDKDGLLDEPCVSCDKAYVEDIWHEWCCDEEECPHEVESEDKEVITEARNVALNRAYMEGYNKGYNKGYKEGQNGREQESSR